MIKKTAVIILTHKNVSYIEHLCKTYKQVNFYVHMDLKKDVLYKQLKEKEVSIENLFLVSERYKVNWGGNSQVRATLAALNEAFLQEENFYFHLISSECLPLKNFDEMVNEWELSYQNKILMEYVPNGKQCWRLKRVAPHADTLFQRKIVGKLLTKAVKFVPFIFPKTMIKKDERVYGSNWMSLQRFDLKNILHYCDKKNISEFEGVLCSDEHFFQVMIKRSGLESQVINNNLRYVHWLTSKTNPNYLSLGEIENISKTKKYWFARKVRQEISIKYLNEHYGKF